MKEVDVEASNENVAKTPARSRAADRESASFFAIHRRGQGKWTRLGTAGVSVVLILGAAYFIANEVKSNAHWSVQTAYIVACSFVVVMSGLAFYLQNKPSNVLFLIDTDSEMQKVNWTTRKELIGSTKIVIGFMMIMALGLFVVDIIFGYFFFLIKVLKFSPFGQ